jgi:hypothetical protein
VLAAVAARELTTQKVDRASSESLSLVTPSSDSNVTRQDLYAYLFDRLNLFSATATKTLASELPENLNSIDDVLKVLDRLMRTYLVEDLTLPDTRIYFAYNMDAKKADQYSIGLVTSRDERWRAGIAAGPESNIHAVFSGTQSKIISSISKNQGLSVSKRANVDELPDEDAVAGFAVTLLKGDGCVGVIGISSKAAWDASAERKVKAVGQELSLLAGAFFHVYSQSLRPPSKSVDECAKEIRDNLDRHFRSWREQQLVMPA